MTEPRAESNKKYPDHGSHEPRGVQDHLNEPDISIDQYTDRCIKVLGQSLQTKRAVYLDTRFWLLLRDADQRSAESPARKLLGVLWEKVDAGLLFCPISENIFVELMKQSDPVSRKATADLIDALSLGITIIPEDMRVRTEIAHFMYSTSGQADLLPLDELVWSKLSYVLGIMHPSNTPFDPATERAVQKAFFDHMWEIPLAQIIEQIGDAEIPGRDLGELARQLNEGITAHSDELRSFRQAYKAEVRGVVDAAGGIAADILPDLATASGVNLAAPTPKERSQAENSFKNLMALALEKGKAQEQLRTMHILASLHASLRWNKGQKFVGNDFFDFGHAVTALAYCGAFFTEKSLRTMITQTHLELDKQFECFVTADITEAAEWIGAVA